MVTTTLVTDDVESDQKTFQLPQVLQFYHLSILLSLVINLATKRRSVIRGHVAISILGTYYISSAHQSVRVNCYSLHYLVGQYR